MAAGCFICLRCDGDGCYEVFSPRFKDHVEAQRAWSDVVLGHGEKTGDAMRDDAAGLGWRRIDDRDLCPRCSRGLPPRGFTLIELLVVLVIVAVVAAVALPVVLSWSRTRAVHSAAEGLHGAIVAAREAAARDRTPKGLRIVPDAAWGPSRGPGGRVDPAKALAGSRVVPLESGPGYSTGLVSIDPRPLPPGFVKPAAVLQLEQSPVDRDGALVEPTAWAWNVRVGDRIRIGDAQADYWVVGPEAVGPADGNVERFVNYVGPVLDRGDGRGPRDYLWLVNGLDDDLDGRVDPGFNGLDDDLDGAIDSAGEWAEVEGWGPVLGAGLTAARYQLLRRPIPAAGPAVELGPAAVDLTGWGLATPPRSRAMVDPWTGAVELIVEPDGRVRPAIVASTPAALGLRGDWIHLWIADRADVQDAPIQKGEARLVSIQGRTGRVVVGEIDPDDPTAAMATAEGR